MSDRSTIEWLARPGTVPATWNPVTGCTKISEGCAHCYAERMSKRLAGRFGYPADEPFAVTVHPDKLEQPLSWKKPRTVFVCSMGDLFHKNVLTQTIALVWRTMGQAPQHTFMVLTKRPERMRRFLERYGIKPLPNVWLGVTAENQKRAEERIPLLLQCPAVVRFVSCEPLLSPLYLKVPGAWEIRQRTGATIDWVIVGGETGPGARAMHPDDARDLRAQCRHLGVPFFFKRMSAKAPTPDDLMVREWPEVKDK